jgi:regulator of protease activity HflC (stomatin/prohibitin superfamily)
MISLIIFAVCLFTAIGIAVVNKRKEEGGDGEFAFLLIPIVTLVLGILISLIQPYSLNRVDAGHVGIKVNLTGSERGVQQYQYKTGWVTYNNWSEMLYEFPTYQQHIEYDSITVITKGGFGAIINPSFNYNLIPSAVGDMFVNLRLDVKQVEQGWLKNAIISSVNDVANKWAVDDIFNNREQFEAAIITECNKRVSKWFTVSQLRTNIAPPKALADAINEKTRAIQLAQGEIQKALVADARAKVKIAEAKGDSAKVVIAATGNANATLINAKADADAMKLKQVQLTSLYIEYIKASTWDGKLPTTSLGGNSGTLLNVK